MSGEFGTGKTIFVLAIVVGCFAVLWPKIFYPMLTASVKQPATARQVQWRSEENVHFLDQLCYLLEEHYASKAPLANTAASPSPTISGARWTADECWQAVWRTCGQDLNETLVEDVRLGRDKSNLTECLSSQYGLTAALVASSAPPRVRLRHYLAQSHARPERPPHLHPEMMHPALREKGRAMPQRTIEKQARPGPMPGVRPPMGGAGGMVPPPQGKGSGAMGIIMPLYTVGIVVFFVYTIMKVLFKKGPDDDKTPKLKDFHLDPEYRKYVFAEEYLDNSEYSSRDQIRRQAREESRSRRKVQQEQQADTKIEDEQLDHLRRRLEETEKAMERLMCQMGSVTDKLTAAKITEVLSQAQAQAKILKDEVGDITSEEDLTSSEALTTTMSEDNSLPTSLQQHLHGLQVEQLTSYSELSVDEVPQLEGEQVHSTSLEADLDLLTDLGEAEAISSRQKEVTVDLSPCQTTVDTVASFEEVDVEAFDPQVNVDAPQTDDIHVSDVSLEQTDKVTEESVVKVERGADREVEQIEQVVASLIVEKDHADEAPQEEMQVKKDDVPSDEQQVEIPEVKSDEVEVCKESEEDEYTNGEGISAEQQAETFAMESDEVKVIQISEESTENQVEVTPDQSEQKQAKTVMFPEEPELKQPEPPITAEEKEEPEPVMVTEETEQKQPETVTTSEVIEKTQPEPVMTPEEIEQTQPESVSTPEEIEPTQPESVSTPEEIEPIQPESVSTPEEIEPIQPESVSTPEEIEPIQPESVSTPEEVTCPEGIEQTQQEPITQKEFEQKDTDQLLKSEEPEQKKSEPSELVKTPDKQVPTTTNESTTCLMTFISDTANKLDIPPSKILPNTGSSGPAEKEDSGTPDEAEADPVPVKKELISEQKVSSDDAEGENIEVEDSSDATETGADISELKSFAEELQGQVKSQPVEEVPIQVPVIESCPSIRMGLADQPPSEESAVECKGQGTQTSLALSAPSPPAVSKEHSTQTDEEKGVAVLGVQTSFRHDEGGVQTRAGSHGPVKTEGITEIVLDALLPSETQLLIKDTQVVGSMPSESVEIDASSADGIPCIVTSHVSLAFVGLERDETGKPQESKKLETVTSIPANDKKPSQECTSSVLDKQMETTTLSAESGTDTTLTPTKDNECHISQEKQVDAEKNKDSKPEEEKQIEVEAKKILENSASQPRENKGEVVLDGSHTDSKPLSPVISAVGKKAEKESSEGSPSVESIAEAVVASTTRAAIERLATSHTDSLIEQQEAQDVSSPSVPSDTLPSSLPKITDIPSDDTSGLQKEAKISGEHAQETQGSDAQTDSSQPPVLYIATITHTPSESPSSTPEKEKSHETVESEMEAAIPPQETNQQKIEKVTQSNTIPPETTIPSQTVEAALADAAEEVCDLTLTKGTKPQEAAAQDSQGATTVSPNEESPTSSKGSSPDMDEYEVINKEEGTAHKVSTQRKTSSGAEPATDNCKAVEPSATTATSSQQDPSHSDEESQPKKKLQKEGKDIKTEERCSSKEPEEQECSSKISDQEQDPDLSPKVTESDSATLCTQSVEEVDTDSLLSKQTISSDKIKSE